MFTQRVAAKEVATALVDAAEAGPKGRIPDLGGPRTEQPKGLVAAYLATMQQKRRIVPLHVPGPMGKAMRKDGRIPARGSAVRRQTFLEWLEAGDAA
jgi:hypothetical protein